MAPLSNLSGSISEIVIHTVHQLRDQKVEPEVIYTWDMHLDGIENGVPYRQYLEQMKGREERAYKAFYLGVWEPSVNRELYEKVEQYYRDTPSTLPNKASAPYARALSRWCTDNGYTPEQLRDAKMNYMRHSPDDE